jgi:hypothetical protein
MLYPPTMAELPPFEQCFTNVIAKAIEIGEEVLNDVLSISTPPSSLAITYESMYAFGNHLRVTSVKAHLTISNYRVATTFEQECQSHSNDRNPIMASFEYVGWIEEILELDYG